MSVLHQFWRPLAAAVCCCLLPVQGQVCAAEADLLTAGQDKTVLPQDLAAGQPCAAGKDQAEAAVLTSGSAGAGQTGSEEQQELQIFLSAREKPSDIYGLDSNAFELKTFNSRAMPGSDFSTLHSSTISCNYVSELIRTMLTPGEHFVLPLYFRADAGPRLDFSVLSDINPDGSLPLENSIKKGVPFASQDVIITMHGMTGNRGEHRVRLYVEGPHHLPTNGNSMNAGALSIGVLTRALGIYSNTDQQGFRAPATKFDSMIYARFAGRFVKPGDKFSDLGQGCSPESMYNCGLYFSGEHVNNLLAQAGEFSPFSAGNGRYGIPLRFNEGIQPVLVLRNALLSDSTFKNYGALTEAELAVLSDLGYDVPLRKFYGHSVYSYGKLGQRQRVVLNSGYSQYDPQTERYEKSPAQTPMGVGLHLYGSYNDVVQNGILAGAGHGSAGVRIDGTGNHLLLPYLSAVIANGDDSAGIVLSGGYNNVLDLDGKVYAQGLRGRGLEASFGSNVYSELSEYRGSYMRSSTLSYERAGHGLNKARSLPLIVNQQGPVASRINISGEIGGSAQAIYLDGSAFVKEINLCGKALVQGDIVSGWDFKVNPETGELFSPDTAPGRVGSILQLTPELQALPPAERSRALHTVLNLGVQKDSSNLQETPAGDSSAVITVNGKICGPRLDIHAEGGKAHLNAPVAVSELMLHNAVIFLDSSAGASQVSTIRMRRGGVLDLGNGSKDVVKVSNGGFISSYASFRADADSAGNMLDELHFNGELDARAGYVSIEPAVSYDELKRLGTDPRQFLNFLHNFVQSAGKAVESYDLYVPVPAYIWDNAGTYGREVQCSARGCRLGAFVSNASGSARNEQPSWRYALSGILLAVMFLGTWLFFRWPSFRVKQRWQVMRDKLFR